MSLDLPGFADPVAEAQAAFRAVLGAMARPGAPHPAGENLQPPAPLAPATAALLLTLADAETPLWLAPAFAPARDWVVFHTGAPLARAPDAAAFVVTHTLPDLSRLFAGTDEAPESSVTVILQVAGFGTGQRLRLSGPGLRAPALLDITGLPADFVARWAGNHALYPRGIDLILTSGASLLALPRGVNVEAG